MNTASQVAVTSCQYITKSDGLIEVGLLIGVLIGLLIIVIWHIRNPVV